MKIDIERLLCSLIECNTKSEHKYNWLADVIITSLRDQGLIYKDGQITPKFRESEDDRIRKEIIDFLELPHPQFVGKRDHEKWIAWLEKQGKQTSDSRYIILDKLIEADNIYQMSVNDAMVEEAKNKAIEALSKLEISKLLGLEKQDKMDMESYKAAEDEKREFVGDGFIKCYADFQDFKEGETYWLEYIGNDNFNVRSDNLLGKTYHITPCQLYTIFKKMTWLEKQSVKKPNYCHHEVDLSECSEEYRKAYYDGWNNCNMQYSQCKSELDDVVKCLINGMKFYYEDNEEATWGTVKWSMPVKHIIEVLEKQGEKKSTDKVEPKFKQGEWIIFNGLILYVDEVVQGYYRTISIDGIPNSYDWDIDNAARLWTIQEAKAGDVLVDVYGDIGIFEERYGTNWHTYCYLGNEGCFISEGGSHGSICYPATKEQRDALMKAIADKGYIFDFEKKELKKIEQKPAWSEEDERIRKAIYSALKYLETELSWDFLGDVDILDAYAWLEKQGEKDKFIKEFGEYKVKYTQEV